MSENVGRAIEIAGRLVENAGRVVLGKRPEIELVVAALVCRGHVLFEDVPGTAKTMLARSLSASIEGAAVGRIQCTPDLQPTDITGLSVWDPVDRTFEFQPGPIFVNVLVVDEINRALPKAQSALLEGMAERQVTVDGVTHPLADPFLLIATENAIEQEGTFPLPEAQLDRFIVRSSLGYPSLEDELAIVDAQLHGHPSTRSGPSSPSPSSGRFAAHEEVYIDPLLKQWAVELVRATREPRHRRGRCVRAREPRARAHGAGARARPRAGLRRRRGHRAALPARRDAPHGARHRRRDGGPLGAGSSSSGSGRAACRRPRDRSQPGTPPPRPPTREMTRPGTAPVPLVPQRRFSGVRFGAHRSPRRGEGDEVAGMRPYRRGDHTCVDRLEGLGPALRGPWHGRVRHP